VVCGYSFGMNLKTYIPYTCLKDIGLQHVYIHYSTFDNQHKWENLCYGIKRYALHIVITNKGRSDFVGVSIVHLFMEHNP
jgi:hypothetical protein